MSATYPVTPCLRLPEPPADPRLRLVLRGRMEAWSLAGVPVLPRSRKTRALLALLGMSPGEHVSRLRLAGLLWSRRGPEQQRGSLRQALRELQQALSPIGLPVLSASRDTVRLREGAVWVDVIEALRSGGATGGEELLSDLDGLDPAFDHWLAEQRRRLREAAPAPFPPRRAAPGPVAGPPPAEAPRLSFPSASRPPRQGLRGARLGVPPLRALGGEAEQHLSVGLAEEITAALARFRWLFVVDGASLAAAAASQGEEGAARALRLDFLLAGTVQRGAGQVRVSLRLTDLRGPATVVWSERFDRKADDILALQDEIAAEVVARIDPEILLIEASRASARGTVHGGAHDLLLRAIPAIHRLERTGFLAAGEWLRQAIALEPDHAAAHAWLAYWHLFLVGQGWAADNAEVLAQAETLASRAVALDPLDAQALTILGHVRAFLHHQVEEAAALHERALALNPNLAMAWVFSGMAQSYLGAHEAALQRFDRYRQLAPCHPHAFFFDAGRGIPLLFLGRYAEAAAVGRAVVALQPGFSYPYKTYLSALGHLGLAAEAAAVRARLLAIEPDFTVAKALRRTPVRRPEDRALYERGLRLAGLE
ncbi:hypothetical protein [Crenalkalicoccus roseus]|uniref:hypothetical protein n=1 Tax=Crenalkalicoccus roseus TaxID=1485588 RepID=UPI001080BD4F|nr:hypothetical protein [Crenalkalicoccus roseus]